MSSAPLFEGDRVPRLVDELVAEQQSLSAVDVFARRHGENELSTVARVYEDRIPVGKTPRADQQLAFRVDLDACTGCKACVTACHSLNGLAEEETWRDVGLLVGTGEAAGLQQTVTTACHHCEDPACLAGCPVQAYEKDPETGIVRHLDDQCIGCQYCVLKCPYDVPKYNAELGIVRKCDMCAGRLAEGEAPACVQGCPNDAISIEIVDQVGAGAARDLLPAAVAEIPDSAYTRPSTRYVSKKRATPLRAANGDRLEAAPAHDPLAAMLILIQLSVGTLLFDVLASAFGVVSAVGHSVALGLAGVSALAGLGAATFHLGRPLYAFRAFLGWRTSWMSRELLALGMYAPLVALAAAARGVRHFPDAPARWASLAEALLPALAGTALLFGLVGTVCSIMIYVDTRRRAWALSRTAPTFAGTAIGLGALAMGTALASSLPSGGGVVSVWLSLIGALVLGAKAVAEVVLLAERNGRANETLARTARLLWGPLRPRLRVRFGLALAGLLATGAALLAAVGGAVVGIAVCSWTSLVCFTLAELVERHLYFTAEASPAMPGH